MLRAPLSCALAIVAGAAPASADTLTWHGGGGLEIEGAAGVTTIAFRGRALVGTTFGSHRVRPAIAAGVTFGVGTLERPDPRMPNAFVATDVDSAGLETELGLQLYARDGEPTTWLFASLAHSAVSGPGDGRGERGALGVNFARTEARHWSCESKNHCNAVAGILLPQQVEAVVESDAASTRYGAALSWGI